MCQAQGMADVIIEGDSFIIWNSLHSTEGFSWPLMPLWRRILLNIKTLPMWRVDLIHRSANSVVDHLAKLGPRLEMLFNTSLPIYIWHIYLSEKCVQESEYWGNASSNQERHLLLWNSSWLMSSSFWSRRFMFLNIPLYAHVEPMIGIWSLLYSSCSF